MGQTSNFIGVIEKLDFGAQLGLIIKSNSQISDILNVISLCMEFDELKRPSI